MIAITNPKIANLVAEWASCRGFSLLFDNPGDGQRPAGPSRILASDVENDPSASFYRNLHAALRSLRLRELMERYLFCALPAASYHVTVWDGANDGNYSEATSDLCELIVLLEGLPDSLSEDNPFSRLINASPLVRDSHEIRFTFAELCNWGDVTLVATLAPADAESSAVLARIREERERLTTEFASAFGFRTSPNPFQPHVSLGYFANPETVQGTHACLAEWNEVFRQAMRDTTIAFRTISLYGFTDMTTFCRGSQTNAPS